MYCWWCRVKSVRKVGSLHVSERHTKPRPVKRTAKHPRRFRDFKDHHPPFDTLFHPAYLLFAWVAGLTVYALLTPFPFVIRPVFILS